MPLDPTPKDKALKSTPENQPIGALLDLKKANMLSANPEYQRGKVWDEPQEKRLIDSVFREYPLPLFYLHHLHKQVAGFESNTLEVIDGQQRLNALHKFREGHFKLFDPVADRDVARFPRFIEQQPCPWGGKTFDQLSPELKEKFLKTTLSIVRIETAVPNEARDLFIRLQAGLPLNAQEKRDAWPGNFTLFVLKVGGKPELIGAPGHEFFPKVMKTKSNDRGESRQLVAQMYMLYAHRRAYGTLCDTKRDTLDDFYYQNLSFDLESDAAQRFTKILNILAQLLGDGKRSKVVNFEAISLVLLVDSLLDNFTPAWRDKFAGAFDTFRTKATEAKATKDSPTPSEYWLSWGLLARSGSDKASSIERRHAFFVSKMTELLQPVPLDPQRLFDDLQRDLIYARDGKKCQVCQGDVLWAEAQIHHVNQHGNGGATDLANGALVHTACHPLSAADVAAFAAKWQAKKATAAQV
jgi:Protein of unknown function DUF262/HNH endonuclease